MQHKYAYICNFSYIRETEKNMGQKKTILVKTYLIDMHVFLHFCSFKDPIELKGGDELIVNCTFQSKSVKQFTYFGLSTSAEMCTAVFTYYPYKPTGISSHSV